MAKKIDDKDIFEGDIFAKAKKDAEALLRILDKVTASFAKMGKEAMGGMPGGITSSSDLKKTAEGFQKIKTATDGFNKSAQERIRLREKLKILNSDTIQQNEELKVQLREQSKINKRLAEEKLGIVKLTREERAIQKDRLILLNKEAGTLERLEASSRQLRRERKGLNTDTKKGSIRLKEINKELDSNGRKIKKNSDTLKKNRLEVNRGAKAWNVFKGVLGALGITSIISGLKNIGQQIFDQSKQISGVQAGFDRLNDPGLLNNLREATKGTVSDLELMKKAVQAKNLGVPIQKLGTFFEFARRRAKETGESVEFLTNSIVDGIGRKSPRILDNLGISTLRLGKELKKTGDFGEAAGNIIEEELQKMGEDLLDTGEKAQRLSSTWSNFITVIAKSNNVVSRFFGNLLTDLNDSLKGLTSLIETGELITKRTLDNIESISQKFAANFRKFVTREQEKGIKNIEILQRLTASLAKTQEDLNAALERGASQNSAFVQSLKGRIDAINKVSASLREEEKITKSLIKEQELLLDLARELPESTERELSVKNRRIQLIEKEIKRLKELGIIEQQRFKTAKDADELIAAQDKKNEAIRQRQNQQAASARDEFLADNVKAIQTLGIERELELLNQAAAEEEFLTNRINTLQKEFDFRKQLGFDTLQLEKDLFEARKALEDKEAADAEKRRKEQIAAANEIADAFVNAQERQTQKQNEAINKELEASRNRVTELKNLATRESLNKDQSIAVEQKRQASLLLEQQRRQRQQQLIELGLTAFKTYGAKVEQGDPNPLSSTIRDITLLTAFIGGLSSFVDGTIDTGTVRKPLDANGGRPAIVHDNERIIDKEINKDFGGVSNKKSGQVMKAYNKGLLVPLSQGVQASAMAIPTYASWDSNAKVLAKFGKMEESLSKISKKPVYMGSDYDENRRYIAHTIKEDNTLTRTLKDARSNL